MSFVMAYEKAIAIVKERAETCNDPVFAMYFIDKKTHEIMDAFNDLTNPQLNDGSIAAPFNKEDYDVLTDMLIDIART